jgi:hypothetical protein
VREKGDQVTVHGPQLAKSTPQREVTTAAALGPSTCHRSNGALFLYRTDQWLGIVIEASLSSDMPLAPELIHALFRTWGGVEDGKPDRKLWPSHTYTTGDMYTSLGEG